MSIAVRRTIHLTVTIDGAEHVLSEEAAAGLARQIDDALGRKQPVKRRAARAALPMDPTTADWSAEDTAFVIDERAKGKTWILLGELLGRTASECKAHHDRVTAL